MDDCLYCYLLRIRMCHSGNLMLLSDIYRHVDFICYGYIISLRHVEHSRLLEMHQILEQYKIELDRKAKETRIQIV